MKLVLNTPIFYEEFGIDGLTVFIQAHTWISNEDLSVSSDEVSVAISIQDRDNMPPLFCTISELDTNGLCDVKIKTIQKKRTDILPGSIITLVTAIDGDRGIGNNNFTYELVSQVPDLGLFVLVQSPSQAELKFIESGNSSNVAVMSLVLSCEIM